MFPRKTTRTAQYLEKGISEMAPTGKIATYAAVIMKTCWGSILVQAAITPGNSNPKTITIPSFVQFVILSINNSVTGTSMKKVADTRVIAFATNLIRRCE
jgi:hypothetical protein